MAASPSTPLHRFAHFTEIAGFIWQVADLLRGDYKQADYGKVALSRIGSNGFRKTRVRSSGFTFL